MSKPITIKVQEEVLREAERHLATSKLKSRNAYINEAIRYMNKLFSRRELAQEYRRQSCLVRDESASVVQELDALTDDIFE